jgi:hypothetical protein
MDMNDELKKLQDDVRRLESQVEALTKSNSEKKSNDVAAWGPLHVAATKTERCRNCKYIRLPHKSNPHYTCQLRHETVEPTWTCGH